MVNEKDSDFQEQADQRERQANRHFWERTFRRTRCNLNGGSGFCCFMRFVANRCGSLLRRILRCRCAAICAATLGYRLPSPGDAWFRRAASSHHVVEELFPRHKIVLRRDLRRVPQPLRHHARTGDPASTEHPRLRLGNDEHLQAHDVAFGMHGVKLIVDSPARPSDTVWRR
jgi:hypothetical protein